MRILFCTTVLPHEKRTGSEIASWQLITAIQERVEGISVVGYTRMGRADSVKAFGDLGYILIGERRIETEWARLPILSWFGRALLVNEPYSMVKYYSNRYCSIVQRMILDEKVDIVIIDHAQVGFLRHVLGNRVPYIVVIHNVERNVYEELCRYASNPLMKLLYRREASLIGGIERQLVAGAKAACFFSNADRRCFLDVLEEARAFVVPLLGAVDGPVKDATEGYDVAIMGTWTWKPNRVGLEWFLNRVYPLIEGEVSVAVAGKGTKEFRKRFRSIKFLGFVKDGSQFLCSGHIICVPSVAGSGVQIKTLDALSLGRPVVATRHAVRGISKIPSYVYIADDHEKFANIVKKIAHDHYKDGRSYKDIAAQWRADRKSVLEATIDAMLSQELR